MRTTGQGFIYIPKPNRAIKGSVTIGGIEVKSKLLTLEVVGVDSAIKTADITLANKEGQYNNSFNFNNVVKVYLDYVDGTTQIFEGELKDKDFTEQPYPKINIYAKDYADQARNEIVNKSYSTDTAISAIFKELIAEKLPTHTTTNVVTTTTAAAPNWTDTNLLKCLQDLMVLAEGNYGFYCDKDKDWHMYEKGTVYNNREALVYGRSLKQPFKFGYSLEGTFNVITIYGKDQKGMPLLYTVSDADSITAYGRNVMPPSKSNNVTTISELKTKAERLLAIMKTPELTGEGNSVGMETLNVGETIPVRALRHNVDGDYVVKEFRHRLMSGKFITSFKVHEKSEVRKGIADLMKEQSDTIKEATDMTNPFDMRYSYPMVFDDSSYIDTAKSSGYDVSGGYVLPTGSSCVVTTKSFTAPFQPVYAHIKVSGADLNNISFKISVNNMSTDQTITPDTKTTITGTGRTIQLECTMTSANAKIESLCVLYSV